MQDARSGAQPLKIFRTYQGVEHDADGRPAVAAAAADREDLPGDRFERFPQVHAVREAPGGEPRDQGDPAPAATRLSRTWKSVARAVTDGTKAARAQARWISSAQLVSRRGRPAGRRRPARLKWLACALTTWIPHATSPGSGTTSSLA